MLASGFICLAVAARGRLALAKAQWAALQLGDLGFEHAFFCVLQIELV